MVGSSSLHTRIRQGSHHLSRHTVTPSASLPAPSGASTQHRHSAKPDRIPTPTWQTDTTAETNATLITDLTTITEEAEMISSTKTGVEMAGAMTMTAEETVEMESGTHLDTNKCSRTLAYRPCQALSTSWSGNTWKHCTEQHCKLLFFLKCF